MSLLLTTLAEQYVFESAPTRPNLGALHVPFDDLRSEHSTEARLDDAVRRGEFVALIGAGGSGKSSIAAHVLGPLVEGVAPLFIPLAAIPADQIDTPAHLVDHLLVSISRIAGSAANRIEADLAPETTTITRIREGGSAFGWRWMSGKMARQVKRQTEIEKRASFIDKQDALGQVLKVISDRHLQPVLVFDDSDRWLKGESIHLVERFFGEGVRWMLDLPAPIVVAVHPHYFETMPPKELLQYLDTRIPVPRLDSVAAIDAILRRRIERKAKVADSDLLDVLAPDASATILRVYSEEGSLRRALRVCHIALHEALSDGAPRITANHIVAASNAG